MSCSAGQCAFPDCVKGCPTAYRFACPLTQICVFSHRQVYKNFKFFYCFGLHFGISSLFILWGNLFFRFTWKKVKKDKKEHKGKLTSRKRSAQAVPGVSPSPTRLQYIYKYSKMDIQNLYCQIRHEFSREIESDKSLKIR